MTSKYAQEHSQVQGDQIFLTKGIAQNNTQTTQRSNITFLRLLCKIDTGTALMLKTKNCVHLTIRLPTLRDMMKDVTVRSCLKKCMCRCLKTTWLISKAQKESTSTARTTDSSLSIGDFRVNPHGTSRDSALDGRNLCKTSAVVATPKMRTIGISADHSLHKKLNFF